MSIWYTLSETFMTSNLLFLKASSSNTSLLVTPLHCLMMLICILHSKIQKIGVYRWCVSLAGDENFPSFYFFSFCLLMTFNRFFATMPPISVTQICTYECVRVSLHTRRVIGLDLFCTAHSRDPSGLLHVTGLEYAACDWFCLNQAW